MQHDQASVSTGSSSAGTLVLMQRGDDESWIDVLRGERLHLGVDILFSTLLALELSCTESDRSQHR
jgi:hypothetical protein